MPARRTTHIAALTMVLCNCASIPATCCNLPAVRVTQGATRGSTCQCACPCARHAHGIVTKHSNKTIHPVHRPALSQCWGSHQVDWRQRWRTCTAASPPHPPGQPWLTPKASARNRNTNRQRSSKPPAAARCPQSGGAHRRLWCSATVTASSFAAPAAAVLCRRHARSSVAPSERGVAPASSGARPQSLLACACSAHTCAHLVRLLNWRSTAGARAVAAAFLALGSALVSACVRVRACVCVCMRMGGGGR